MTLLSCLRVLIGREGQKLQGFPVSAMKAVEVLASANPDAASWRREHTPHLLRKGQRLVFEESACVLVE